MGTRDHPELQLPSREEKLVPLEKMVPLEKLVPLEKMTALALWRYTLLRVLASSKFTLMGSHLNVQKKRLMNEN